MNNFNNHDDDKISSSSSSILTQRRTKSESEPESESEREKELAEPMDESIQQRLIENYRTEYLTHARHVRTSIFFICWMAWICTSVVLLLFPFHENHHNDYKYDSLIHNPKIALLHLYSFGMHCMAAWIGKGQPRSNAPPIQIPPSKSTSIHSNANANSNSNANNETNMQMAGLVMICTPLLFLYYNHYNNIYTNREGLLHTLFHVDALNPWIPLLGNFVTMLVSIILRRDVISNFQTLHSLEKARYNFKSV